MRRPTTGWPRWSSATTSRRCSGKRSEKPASKNRKKIVKNSKPNRLLARLIGKETRKEPVHYDKSGVRVQAETDGSAAPLVHPRQRVALYAHGPAHRRK